MGLTRLFSTQEIKNQDLGEMIFALKSDLKSYYRLGVLLVRKEEIQRREYTTFNPSGISLVYLGLKNRFKPERVFSIHDGKTGNNFISAWYGNEEILEIVKRHAGNYERKANINIVLQKYVRQQI